MLIFQGAKPVTWSSPASNIGGNSQDHGSWEAWFTGAIKVTTVYHYAAYLPPGEQGQVEP